MTAPSRPGRRENPRPTFAEPHPERYSYEAAVNGDYPALCGDADCGPCKASETAGTTEGEVPA